MSKGFNKITGLLLSVTLLFSLFPKGIYAAGPLSSQASSYIRSTSVNMFPKGNGMILLENKLGATRIAGKLGLVTLEVQAMKNGYWQSIDVLASDDYLYHTGTYIYDTCYYGTPGIKYRTYAEFYVESDGGHEVKAVTATEKRAE